MKTASRDASFFVAVSGGSMKPTLREPEMLEVAPLGVRPARVGDVILFTPPRGERAVAHRVVRVTEKGVRTRGDNNVEEDPFLTPPEAISGRVEAAWRGPRRRVVAGGPRGWWTFRLRRLLGGPLVRWLRTPYRALARRGWLRRLAPAAWRPRVVLFRVNGRDRPMLLMGRRIVGRPDADGRQWVVQRPFRLFVDESELARFSTRAHPSGPFSREPGS